MDKFRSSKSLSNGGNIKMKDAAFYVFCIIFA